MFPISHKAQTLFGKGNKMTLKMIRQIFSPSYLMVSSWISQHWWRCLSQSNSPIVKCQRLFHNISPLLNVRVCLLRGRRHGYIPEGLKWIRLNVFQMDVEDSSGGISVIQQRWRESPVTETSRCAEEWTQASYHTLINVKSWFAKGQSEIISQAKILQCVNLALGCWFYIFIFETLTS